MEIKDLIARVKEYNKTLPIDKSNFERALYKNTQEANYYIYFDRITGPQYVDNDPEVFLKKHHHFSKILKTTSYLLDVYIKHVKEYSMNKDYLRISARSSHLSDHYTYLLSKIGSFYLYEGGDLDLKTLIYGGYRNLNIDFSPVIGAYLLLNDEKAIAYTKDVLLSENNTGVLTRDLIIAIEMCHNEELHNLLLQVFLAARLQEGLRQSVAETCDEFTLEFFKKALNVIIDNHLIRYSSIQRAVLTWCGLGTDHFEERDAKVLLSLFDKYVLNKCPIEEALNSDNPLELYIALYAIGIEDNNKAVNIALSYLKDCPSYQVASVLTYLRLSRIFKSEEHLYLFDMYKDNDWIMALFFNRFSQQIVLPKDKAHDYFIKIEKYAREFKTKKKIKTKGFEWFETNLEQYTVINVLHKLLKLNETKETVTSFLPYIKHITYKKDFDEYMKKAKKLIDNDILKNFYIENLNNTNSTLQKECKESLKTISLNEEDLKLIEDKLKSKRSEIRSSVMEIINKQPIDMIIKSHDRLSNCKDEYQKNGAKDIERRYPEVFNIKQEKIFYSKEEGFNLYQPVKIKERSHESYLTIKKEGFFKKLDKIELQYNFKTPKDKIISILKEWNDLYTLHEDDSYKLYGVETTLSQSFRRDFSKKDSIESLPLKDIWLNYYNEHPIDEDTLRTIYILSYTVNSSGYYKQTLTIDKIFDHHDIYCLDDLELTYLHQVLNILNSFYLSKCNHQLKANLELLELFIRNNTHMVLKHQYMNHSYSYSITTHSFIKYLLDSVEKGWQNDEEFRISFDLMYDYYYKYCFKNNRNDTYTPTPLFFVKAYRMDYISRDELFSILFNDNKLSFAFIQAYFHEKGYYLAKPDMALYDLTPYSKEDIQLLRDLLSEVTDSFLNMETHRLNEDTPVTEYLKDIKVIKGLKYIPMILNALGKDSFSRSTWARDKKTVLTQLIRNTYPNPDEDLTLLKGINDTKIVEICMLAPQWIPIFDKYLNWNGFISGCYYFIAHMKDYDVERKKAMIAKYTELEPTDLIDGAFDNQWCKEVYEQLGAKRFDILYKAAKYLCDNAFHTRARKYADACLDKLNKEEVLSQVKDKRNKDLLNAYCIIPLKDDNDLKERYLYIQQFLKESKKFGSQRQASEKRTCEIALINLARNSRYENSTRLTWAMETKIVVDKMEVLKPHKIDDYEVYIEIDEIGKNSICIINPKGKKQKSIPAKIKKLESFIEIQNIHKQWNEQYRRSKKLLEEAMEDRTEFYKEEILTIFENPVIRPMVEKLLFIQDNEIGYIKNNELYCLGISYPLKDKLRIAHCYDLYISGKWQQYQEELFNAKISQPFKQIFRELYTKLEDELDKNISQRYSGYQIQVKKAIGALKSRRWNINYESGIERVYYKDDLVVNLYAEADWFSPSEIEAPAIDYVSFHERKNYKNRIIKDINDITYSEAMRDLDMACSIAYVGGVDPITSFSTIELRKNIILLTAKLMKLNNIIIKDNFAYIDGKLGNYTVHLGSGIIHQKYGSSIHVLPVHSQKRGKLYLPFIDDDPKCQEILSKIIMLSEDYKIKDPSILSQIKPIER